MGGTTANFGFRYLALTDPPNIASGLQNLATDVDTALLAEQTARVALAGTVAASGYGRLGSCAYTTVNAVVTTEVMLNTFTVNCVAGRRYRAFITGSAKYGGTTDVGEFILRYEAGASVTVAAGTVLFIHEMPAPAAVYGSTETAVWEFTSPGTGQYSFGLSAAHAAGSGSMNIVPDSHQPCQLAIDDIGT